MEYTHTECVHPTYTALNIPYEIVAINVLLTYWTDKVPAAAVVVIVMAIFG